MKEKLYQKSLDYLNFFCREIKDRSVGSPGNRKATKFFKNKLLNLGWENEIQKFEALDWENEGADLRAGNNKFEVFVSPYSLGCSVEGKLAAASSLNQLKAGDFKNKILLLYGELTKEQLMPKNFVFYNPESHQKIVKLLEHSEAKAIITATDRNAALAGGIYPFPLIEDGDFEIPSVYMKAETGEELLKSQGENVSLISNSKRISGTGYNVLGKKGNKNSKKIVITAHIDAKKGSPGAIDNATGVTILLILAELLSDYQGDYLIEIVAFNGEDYYSVPGQMEYIKRNKNNFSQMLLNINIDGAAYKIGKTSFSSFDLGQKLLKNVTAIINDFPGIVEGRKWAQGDHSIFLQSGVPAVAVSSKWFIDNLDSQEITHTAEDKLEIVDPSKIVEIAEALNGLVRKI